MKVIELSICLVLLVSIVHGEETMKESEKATFGAGCFWCVEAVFQRLEGVKDVVPGYCGGTKVNPTYNEVCTGRTGHAEVAQITFNPETISFDELLNMFWLSHDPTTKNRQGNDVGTQYRSIIFFHNAKQELLAKTSKKNLEKIGRYKKKIITEIVPTSHFYMAEECHQKYYEKRGLTHLV